MYIFKGKFTKFLKMWLCWFDSRCWSSFLLLENSPPLDTWGGRAFSYSKIIPFPYPNTLFLCPLEMRDKYHLPPWSGALEHWAAWIILGHRHHGTTVYTRYTCTRDAASSICLEEQQCLHPQGVWWCVLATVMPRLLQFLPALCLILRYTGNSSPV